MEKALELILSLQQRLGPGVDIALRANHAELIFCFKKIEKSRVICKDVRVTRDALTLQGGCLVETAVKQQLEKEGTVWLLGLY